MLMNHVRFTRGPRSPVPCWCIKASRPWRSQTCRGAVGGSKGNRSKMRRVPQSRRETNIPDSLPLEPVFLYNPLVCGRDRSMSACGSRTPDLKKKKNKQPQYLCIIQQRSAGSGRSREPHSREGATWNWQRDRTEPKARQGRGRPSDSNDNSTLAKTSRFDLCNRTSRWNNFRATLQVGCTEVNMVLLNSVGFFPGCVMTHTPTAPEELAACFWLGLIRLVSSNVTQQYCCVHVVSETVQLLDTTGKGGGCSNGCSDVTLVLRVCKILLCVDTLIIEFQRSNNDLKSWGGVNVHYLCLNWLLIVLEDIRSGCSYMIF